MKKGFTLIETVIYIALFSILIVGGFITAYELIDSTQTLASKSTIQAETNFILRKMNWALTNVSSVSSPSTGNLYSNTLSLIKYDGNQIDIRLNNSKIEIREGGASNPYIPISTDNVIVNYLGFSYIPANGTAPAGIEATTTIQNVTSTMTKYIRK